MPAKDVSAFFEKVAQVKTLQAKLKKMQAQLSKENQEASAAATVKIAAAAGFKFTAKELLAARKAAARKRPAGQAPEVTAQGYCSGGFDTYSWCYW